MICFPSPVCLKQALAWLYWTHGTMLQSFTRRLFAFFSKNSRRWFYYNPRSIKNSMDLLLPVITEHLERVWSSKTLLKLQENSSFPDRFVKKARMYRRNRSPLQRRQRLAGRGICSNGSSRWQDHSKRRRTERHRIRALEDEACLRHENLHINTVTWHPQIRTNQFVPVNPFCKKYWTVRKAINWKKKIWTWAVVLKQSLKIYWKSGQILPFTEPWSVLFYGFNLLGFQGIA